MKKLKRIKLMLTALFLGLPISSVFVDTAQEAEATMRVGSAVSKLGSTIRPTLLKPPIAPKPTNVPKIPNHIAQKLNQNKTPNQQPIVKNALSQKISFFNNPGISTEKPQGPITQKVNKLNLSAKLPNSNGVNSSTGSLKEQSPKPKTEVSRKLSLNSDFKSKLNSIFAEGNQSDKKLNLKPTNTPNKLNSDSVNKLEGLFGGGNKNSSGSPSNVFVNTDPSVPPAPPLNLNSKTPSTNSAIPPAPPLPNQNQSIPSAPPLSSKKPTTVLTDSGSGGNLQNQLTSKLNSGLNKTEQIPNRKPLSKSPSSAQESLIAELQSKLNSRK